jgi:hypothetical protein
MEWIKCDSKIHYACGTLLTTVGERKMIIKYEKYVCKRTGSFQAGLFSRKCNSSQIGFFSKIITKAAYIFLCQLCITSRKNMNLASEFCTK